MTDRSEVPSERLDESNLFDGQESLSNCDDVFHVTSRVVGVDVLPERYPTIGITLDVEMIFGMRM